MHKLQIKTAILKCTPEQYYIASCEASNVPTHLIGSELSWKFRTRFTSAHSHEHFDSFARTQRGSAKVGRAKVGGSERDTHTSSKVTKVLFSMIAKLQSIPLANRTVVSYQDLSHD